MLKYKPSSTVLTKNIVKNKDWRCVIAQQREGKNAFPETRTL